MADLTNLFEMMKKRGIKAIQLSRDTGISTGLIADWKHGRKTPAAKNLAILCQYFNVDAAFILGYQDTEKSAPTEADTLNSDIIRLFANLPPEKQAEALNYIKYLATQDKP